MRDSFDREIQVPKFKRTTVLNGTESPIPSGTVVCAVRYSGTLPVVAPFFDGGLAIGVLAQELEVGGRASVVILGIAVIPPSLSFSPGDVIYASESGLTNIDSEDVSQIIGYVTNNGRLFVSMKEKPLKASHKHTAAGIDSATSIAGHVLTSDGDGNAAWQAVDVAPHRHTSDDIDSATADAGHVLTSDGDGNAEWQAINPGLTAPQIASLISIRI